MQLKPIQIAILIVQIFGIAFQLYAIFLMRVADLPGHWLSIAVLLTIMGLSLISWKTSAHA